MITRLATVLSSFNGNRIKFEAKYVKQYLAVMLLVMLLTLPGPPAQAQQFDWAKRAGSSRNDFVSAIAADEAGNSYVTGFFGGTVTFGEGGNIITLTSVSSSNDIYVAKYDSDGNPLWAKRAGGTFTDNGQDIAVDAAGNSYITGRFAGIAMFGEGASTVTLTTPFFSDIFVAKYDSNGNLLWAKQAGNIPNDDIGFGIAVDAAGNSHITGIFRNTAIFGEGDSATTLTSTGSNDIFVAKYDSNGDLLWAKRAGGSAIDQGSAISLDSAGNSLVIGNIQGTVTFGEGSNTTTLSSIGSSDIFVAKYDSSGNLLWVKQIGGSAPGTGRGIAVDGTGNSYISGNIQGTTTFGEGENAITLISANTDIFTAKYDSDGNVLWAKRAGGSFFDLGNAIAVDEIGNSYITGHFDDPTATFGEGANTIILTGTGSINIFIANYDPGGNLLWAKSAGSLASGEGEGIATDGVGNSYVTGAFQGTVTFGEGDNAQVLTSIGFFDIFVAKFSMANLPPMANAGGPYSGAEGSPIALNNATISDADGDILTSAWTVNSPLCQFSDPAVLQPTITCSDNGDYIATLTVDDGVQEPVSSEAFILVENVAPVVILTGNPMANEGETFTYSYTASDPGSDTFILIGETCGVGGAVVNATFDDLTGAGNFDCAFPDGPTTTEVNVIIADDDSGSDDDILAVTVNNIAPTALFANLSGAVIEGETAALGFSDPVDPSLIDVLAGFLYSYDCTGDGIFELMDDPASSYACQYPDSGSFSARGLIKDKDGDFTAYSVEITVLAPIAAIQHLIGTIEGFNLDHGTENSLIAKLASAQQTLEDGNENNDDAAVNSLQAFINAIEAQRGKNLTDEQADLLIELAQRIINSLS